MGGHIRGFPCMVWFQGHNDHLLLDLNIALFIDDS